MFLLLAFIEFSIYYSLATNPSSVDGLAPISTSRPTSDSIGRECTQPSFLDVRQLHPAFQKGLGRVSVLKGDKRFNKIFNPSLFDSMLHDFDSESKLQFVSHFDNQNKALTCDGTISKIGFDANAFTVTKMDTISNNDKEIRFTGSFKNFKVKVFPAR
jgi:hypothetical protein